LGEATASIGVGRRARRARVTRARDVDDFALVLCHDLAEPLRTVTQAARELAQGRAGADPNAAEQLQRIQGGLERMHEMLRALQSFAQSGARAPERHPVDTGAAVSRALANLDAAVRESGAEVTRDPLPIVQADPFQLMLVFQNLLSNAVKFRDGRSPRIHVSARREGDAWLFSVRDNGIGIEPRRAREVFDLFRRLHPRERFEGTGVGLAICERVIRRHGGRIWVESRPGEGATLCFTLPDV
jgi:light-regulated signal transduction histidine kinase (bacteriophytochrome)